MADKEMPFGDEDDLFRDACEQWFEYSTEMGSISPDTPSKCDSEVDVWKGTVHLRNVNGLLAICQISEDGEWTKVDTEKDHEEAAS